VHRAQDRFGQEREYYSLFHPGHARPAMCYSDDAPYDRAKFEWMARALNAFEEHAANWSATGFEPLGDDTVGGSIPPCSVPCG
jgi:hypothetical protein